MEKKDQPDYKNNAYTYMSESWQRMADVCGGVRAVRDANYLIQFERESPEDYAKRKKQTEFYNVTGHTIDGTVGLICSNEVAPNDPPKPLVPFLRDVDLLGNDLQAFLRVTLTNGIRDGHSLIFVDGPPAVQLPDGQKPTLADVADRRAYWINYKASQLINWRYEIVNGKPVLEQATFEECTNEPDGEYGEKKVTRYRVHKIGSYSLYEKNERDEIVPVPDQQNVQTGGKQINLVPYYARRTGMLESVPPFLDLMETNVTHFNSQAKLRKALEYVVPMPIFKLEKAEDKDAFTKIVASPNRSIIMWGANVGAEYLELKGDSVPALRNDITDLENRMAKLGVEKFAPAREEGTKTATEVGSDNRKELSEIAMYAKNLEQTVEQAFFYTAEMENRIKGNGTVDISEAEMMKLRLNIDYDRLTFDNERLRLFSDMVTAGNLSKRTFLTVFGTQYKKELPVDWDVEKEILGIKADAPKEALVNGGPTV